MNSQFTGKNVRMAQGSWQKQTFFDKKKLFGQFFLLDRMTDTFSHRRTEGHREVKREKQIENENFFF